MISLLLVLDVSRRSMQSAIRESDDFTSLFLVEEFFFFFVSLRFVDCNCNICILAFTFLLRSQLGKIRGKNGSSLLMFNIAVALLC